MQHGRAREPLAAMGAGGTPGCRNEAIGLEHSAPLRVGRSGAKPEPTVQSGWEKAKLRRQEPEGQIPSGYFCDARTVATGATRWTLWPARSNWPSVRWGS